MKMKRLKTIIDFIPSNSIIADIGTDHGVVPIYLLENSRAKKVIGADISARSLEKLENKISNLPPVFDIDTRVSDGLEKILPFEVDTVVIAGMGGFLIEKILSQSLEKTRTFSCFVLQANNGLSHLRNWLIDNRFEIIDENDLFENDIYYSVILAKNGLQEKYSDLELKYGKMLIEKRSKILKEYITQEKKEKTNLMEILRTKKGSSISARIEELESDLQAINEILSLYN